MLERFRMILAVSLLGSLLLWPGDVAEAKVIYTSSFDTDAHGFSNTSREPYALNSNLILGLFSEQEETVLSLENVFEGDTIRLKFGLLLKGTWDGNNVTNADDKTIGPDTWTLTAGGLPPLINATFANYAAGDLGMTASSQSYADDQLTGGRDRLPFTGSDGGDRTNSDFYRRYATYNFGGTTPGSPLLEFLATGVSGDTLAIHFKGDSIEPDRPSKPNESWGLTTVSAEKYKYQLLPLSNGEGSTIVTDFGDDSHNAVGLMNWEGASILLRDNFENKPGGSITNLGTITVNSQAELKNSDLIGIVGNGSLRVGAGGWLRNLGTITVDQPAGNVEVGGSATNTGTMDVRSGGTFTISGGGVFTQESGSFVGAGKVRNNDRLIVKEGFQFGGEFYNYPGASATFRRYSSFVDGARVSNVEGAAIVVEPAPGDHAALTLGYGSSTTNSGTLRLSANGGLFLDGGTLWNGADLFVDPGGVFTDTTSGRTSNEGYIYIADGGTMVIGGALTNTSTGFIAMSGGACLYHPDHFPNYFHDSFRNDGDLTVGGTSTFVNGETMYNTGGVWIRPQATFKNDQGDFNNILNGQVEVAGVFENTGWVWILPGSRFEGSGTYRQTAADAVTVVGGLLQIGDIDIQAGQVIGFGSLGLAESNVTVGADGTVNPGNSPGTLTVEGDLTLDGGKLLFEIAGDAASQKDHLVVNGNFIMNGGSVQLAFIDGYRPVFDPLNGNYTYFTLNQFLSAGAVFVLGVLEVTATGIPANEFVYVDVDGSGNYVQVYGTPPAVQHPPVLIPPGDKTVVVGQALEFAVHAADIDGDTLTYAADNLPSGANFDSGTHAFTWTPGLDQAGTYPDVAFTVTDNGTPPLSVSRSITITVLFSNQAPSFKNGPWQTVLEDAGPQTVVHWATQISAGPPAEIGQALDFVVWNDNNALFSVQPAIAPNGTLTYTPAPDANGVALVTTYLHDNGGTANGGADTSGWLVFRITVTPVNDPPVAADDSAAITAGATWQRIDVLANDSSAPDTGETLVVTGATPGLHGETRIEAGGGAVEYRPTDVGYRGADEFMYTIDDGNGGTAVATVRVSISSSNEAPVFDPVAPQTVAEGITLRFSVLAHDPDGNAITYESLAGPPGSLFDPVTRTFTWTPLHAQVRGAAWQASFGATDDGAPPAAAVPLDVPVTVVPALFFDDFSHGTRAGDKDWIERQGDWSVDAAKRYVSSPRLPNLATVSSGAVASFATGRIAAKVVLGAARAPNASLVFAYRSKASVTLHRYVRILPDRILIGESGGMPSQKKLKFTIGRAYLVSADLAADGRVTVSVDGVPRHSFKFPRAVAGKVGVAANLARSSFDDLTVWSSSMVR